jgi:hypothetical protein
MKFFDSKLFKIDKAKKLNRKWGKNNNNNNDFNNSLEIKNLISELKTATVNKIDNDVRSSTCFAITKTLNTSIAITNENNANICKQMSDFRVTLIKHLKERENIIHGQQLMNNPNVIASLNYLENKFASENPFVLEHYSNYKEDVIATEYDKVFGSRLKEPDGFSASSKINNA